MKFYPIIRGIISYLPFCNKLRKGTGGTDSSRYCYSVWLRHLVMLFQNGMREIPNITAEIGPGDSLGIGICSLLTGSDEYYAFDIIRHANEKQNMKIFIELVQLFKKREPIPDDSEFPNIIPKIASYEFPNHILSNKNIDNALNETRLNKIRKAISGSDGNEITNPIILKYVAPWDDNSIITSNKIDLIYSQAVMEHIIQLDHAYDTMFKWLKHGGFMSHAIDYSAHETHNIPNGHLRYSTMLWKLIMHGRPYPLNRILHSQHIRKMKESGFRIIKELNTRGDFKTDRNKLDTAFKNMSDNDLSTPNAFIITKKE